MKSRLYEGTVRHRRLKPRIHEFQYRVFMPYICLDELPGLFANTMFWSASAPALGRFKRSDFLGDARVPLQDEVRRRIYEETGIRHSGPIYLLANLRYFGHIMNPIACYYCFSEDEQRLEFLVAEVNNTPWDERHSYVLEGDKVFDATLSLAAQPLTAGNLNRYLLRYPFMTAKVGLAIYWQALRLYFKGVPVYSHPATRHRSAQ